MNRLNIKLSINSACELVAEDLTNYDSFEFNNVKYDSHITVEGIVGIRDKVADLSTINCRGFVKLPNHTFQNITKIKFPKDGTFTYYKILVPKLSHFENLLSECLFYNDDKNSNNYGQICFKDSLDKEKVIPPTHLVELIELSNLPNVIYFEQIVFTACKLQKCLVNLQRKTVNDVLCGTCRNNTVDVQNRDLLLSAMYVLDYLKDRSEFEKAQEILDNMGMCQLCEDISLDNSKCGCN